jgi:hypothetical protein
MTDSLWTKDMSVLYEDGRWSEIWPFNSTDTTSEKVNAATRFILYYSAIQYYRTRNTQAFLLGAGSVLALTAFNMKDSIPARNAVSRPSQNKFVISKNNPMGNQTLGYINEKQNNALNNARAHALSDKESLRLFNQQLSAMSGDALEVDRLYPTQNTFGQKPTWTDSAAQDNIGMSTSANTDFVGYQTASNGFTGTRGGGSQ